MILPSNKAPFSKSIPPFILPELTEEDVEKYQDQRFGLYSFKVEEGALPVVIAVHPDRIHVFNDRSELKYNAFNQDLYSKALGFAEVELRKNVSEMVIYGFILDWEQIPNRIVPSIAKCLLKEYGADIHVFHIWNNTRQEWLDSNQYDKLQLPRPFQKSAMDTSSTLRNIIEIWKQIPSKKCHVIKNINDPAIFFRI